MKVCESPFVKLGKNAFILKRDLKMLAVGADSYKWSQFLRQVSKIFLFKYRVGKPFLKIVLLQHSYFYFLPKIPLIFSSEEGFMFFFKSWKYSLFSFFPGGKWFNVKFKGGREMYGNGWKTEASNDYPIPSFDLPNNNSKIKYFP